MVYVLDRASGIILSPYLPKLSFASFNETREIPGESREILIQISRTFVANVVFFMCNTFLNFEYQF